MKAIRVSKTGGPEVLVLHDHVLPPLEPGQVRVRLHAIGVNPVETYIRSGNYALPPLPYTPGSDAAGVVEEIGQQVTRVAVGDRVYTAGTITGAYAEQTLCQERQVHRLPDSISFEQGSALNIPYATAYRALFQKARALPGETVLIHGGSGGVGVAATQLARAAGLNIIATAGSAQGQILVKQQGAHHALNHHGASFTDQLKAAAGGNGVNIVLEMLANVNLGKDLSLLAKNGRIVIIGSRGPVEINPRDAMSRDAVIYGMTLFNATEQDAARIHTALGAQLEMGCLKPVIGRTFPLAEASRAHEAILQPGSHGKIVLLP